MKEITIRGPDMARRSDTGASPKDHLARHELAVVLTERPRWRSVAWVGGVGTCCPLPTVSEKLVDAVPLRRARVQLSGFEEISRRRVLGRGDFPLLLGR